MSDAIQRIREALAWSARAFGDHSDDIRALLDRLDAAVREIERLRHDIERHIAIASEHATECERLRAELAACRRDAERYRWLRGDVSDNSIRWSEWEIWYLNAPQRSNDLHREHLDSAIDAALAKEDA